MLAAPAVPPLWDAYRALLAEEVARPPAHWTFKSHPAYRQFLEHATPEQGEAYLALLCASPDWSAGVASVVIAVSRTGMTAAAYPECKVFIWIPGGATTTLCTCIRRMRIVSRSVGTVISANALLWHRAA